MKKNRGIMKKVLGTIFLLLVFALVIYLGLFNKKSSEPHVYYNVYLKSELIGTVESKKELESYIDKKGEEIKKKYNVKTIYAPTELEIVKSVSFKEKIDSASEVYDKINAKDAFSINGYRVKIAARTEDEKDLIIYVTTKDLFSNALEQVISTFIGKDRYEDYKNHNQAEIVTTGEVIEDVYIDNEITTKEEKIPVTEKIYASELELSQYLLFGDNQQYKKYVVKSGDTIESIIDKNEISIEEFLITNLDIKSAQSLLYTGQVVTINTINTKLDVVQTTYLVEDVETRYSVEEKTDLTLLEGTTKKVQEGQNGVNRVSQKVKSVNGVITYVSPVSNEELKPTTSEIWVVGGKIVPNVGSLKIWGWPTDSGYRITSDYAWRINPVTRIREFHKGIDISGLGYGKPIYAANNGTIFSVQYNSGYGYHIVINHNNGYYTLYAHMKAFAPNMTVGKTVSRGQVIGYIGSTGRSTGPHLHFELWNGAYQRTSPWTFYKR